MNVIMFDQTPGTDAAACGMLAQRSGLEKKEIGFEDEKVRADTNLNSAESSPHIDLSRLTWLMKTTIS